MIDAERWVLAEAWIANGLRVRWGAQGGRAGHEGWQGDGSETYRYVGWGEWEMAAPYGFVQRPLGIELAPQLSTDMMRHELAHWLIATEEQRQQQNFGMHTDSDEAEQQALAAERVLHSVVAAAARIIGMALVNGKART